MHREVGKKKESERKKKKSKWNQSLSEYHLDLTQQNKTPVWDHLWLVSQWKTSLKQKITFEYKGIHNWTEVKHN